MKEYYKNTLIPAYVIRHLERYDRTIITKPAIKRIGGIKKTIEILKQCGYTCTMEKSCSVIVSKSRNGRVFDHMVLVLEEK